MVKFNQNWAFAEKGHTLHQMEGGKEYDEAELPSGCLEMATQCGYVDKGAKRKTKRKAKPKSKPETMEAPAAEQGDDVLFKNPSKG